MFRQQLVRSLTIFNWRPLVARPLGTFRFLSSYQPIFKKACDGMNARGALHNVSSLSTQVSVKNIENVVKSHKIVVFLKGSPESPKCGFSKRLVSLLAECKCDDFTFVDVTKYPDIREAVKQYSKWPTLPQLFVDGDFVGGVDIVQGMMNSGELQSLLGSSKSGK